MRRTSEKVNPTTAKKPNLDGRGEGAIGKNVGVPLELMEVDGGGCGIRADSSMLPSNVSDDPDSFIQVGGVYPDGRWYWLEDNRSNVATEYSISRQFNKKTDRSGLKKVLSPRDYDAGRGPIPISMGNTSLFPNSILVDRDGDVCLYAKVEAIKNKEQLTYFYGDVRPVGLLESILPFKSELNQLVLFLKSDAMEKRLNTIERVGGVRKLLCNPHEINDVNSRVQHYYYINLITSIIASSPLRLYLSVLLSQEKVDDKLRENFDKISRIVSGEILSHVNAEELDLKSVEQELNDKDRNWREKVLNGKWLELREILTGEHGSILSLLKEGESQANVEYHVLVQRYNGWLMGVSQLKGNLTMLASMCKGCADDIDLFCDFSYYLQFFRFMHDLIEEHTYLDRIDDSLYPPEIFELINEIMSGFQSGNAKLKTQGDGLSLEDKMKFLHTDSFKEGCSDSMSHLCEGIKRGYLSGKKDDVVNKLCLSWWKEEITACQNSADKRWDNQGLNQKTYSKNMRDMAKSFLKGCKSKSFEGCYDPSCFLGEVGVDHKGKVDDQKELVLDDIVTKKHQVNVVNSGNTFVFGVAKVSVAIIGICMVYKLWLSKSLREYMADFDNSYNGFFGPALGSLLGWSVAASATMLSIGCRYGVFSRMVTPAVTNQQVKPKQVKELERGVADGQVISKKTQAVRKQRRKKDNGLRLKFDKGGIF